MRLFNEVVLQVELVRGGRERAVTAANRVEYIHAVANYRLCAQIQAATDAFRRGLTEVAEPEWVRPLCRSPAGSACRAAISWTHLCTSMDDPSSHLGKEFFAVGAASTKLAMRPVRVRQIGGAQVRMFNEEELQALVAGQDEKGFSLADLRAHATYANGYAPDHPTIAALWQAGPNLL